jgi:hypothetical protein
MNRSVWLVLILAATTASASSGDEKIITVTGCVQNFSAKGTVGTTEKGYLLTNATTGGADAVATPAPRSTAATDAGAPAGASETAAGASGTAAGPTPPSADGAATRGTGGTQTRSSRADSSYLLEGHESELKDHVGRKVEVTGTLQPRDQEASKTEELHLEVSSVRRVASSCTLRPK